MDEKLNILVVDDEAVVRHACVTFCNRGGHVSLQADTGQKALELLSRYEFDLVLADLMMPDLDGIELLKQIKQRHPQTDVVIMSGFATIETAVEAMRYGAYDYFSKPLLPGALNKIIEKLVSKKRWLRDVVPGELAIEYESDEKIIGQSQAMKEVFHLIKKVAPTDSTVLITGESGTGKDLIAKAIHYNSLRREKPFMAVDCGSLVETLFESELFGHVKGSFTGAIAQKHGSFELAHGGTFFFDEIGNISLNIQAKILRAIQEKEIKPVGDVKTIKVDVRVIAATNQNLVEMVEKGKFREDLFYRLNVVLLEVPALRNREDDVPLLAAHFLTLFSEKNRKKIKGFTPAAMDCLIKYNWPGNVRELMNTVERTVVLARSDYIDVEELPMIQRQPLPENTFAIRNLEQGSFQAEGVTLETIEKTAIINTLHAVNSNKSEAARRLGITRKTLHKKLKQYGLMP